jgi:two-component system chemotaxis sensor kinase CheA
VQYRNTILPLVDIGATLGYMPSNDVSDSIQVVVYSQHGRMVGFVVDRILDIVEQVATVHQASDRPGIVGSIVVQGSVTDLLDIQEIIQSVAPWYESAEVAAAQEALTNV